MKSLILLDGLLRLCVREDDLMPNYYDQLRLKLLEMIFITFLTDFSTGLKSFLADLIKIVELKLQTFRKWSNCKYMVTVANRKNDFSLV